MEPQPQYKNRSKGNQRSICPSCNLSSFFSGMILYNMMLFLNYSLHVKWYQWIFWRVAVGKEGGEGKKCGEGSRCAVGVFVWNIHWEMMGNAWVGRCGDGVGGFTSWHSGLRERHPPLPLAAVDATGQWGDGGWPACRTSVSAQPLWTCFLPRSSQWHHSCQSCRNPALWSQLGFSGRAGRKDYKIWSGL